MAGKKTSKTKADTDPTQQSKADAVEGMEPTSQDDGATASQMAPEDTNPSDAKSLDQDDTPDDLVTGEAESPEAESPESQSAEPEITGEGETQSADDAASDTPTAEESDAETPYDATETDAVSGSMVESEIQPEPEAEPERQTIVKKEIVERPVSIIPLLLGGLLAGGVGFGAAFYGLTGDAVPDTAALEDRLAAEQQAQDARITALSDQLETLPPPADLSAVETTQAELSGAIDDLTDRLGSVENQIGALETRLNELEKRPINEGASDAAVAAYERELQALQDAMATQRAEIEAMTAEATRSEENAEAIARDALQRTALSRIRTALDSGTGFADALAELEETGVAAPDALSSVAEEGVPTLAELEGAFPSAARTALAAAREAAATEGDGAGFGDFLRSQLGARSLEPREGDDPDAVLSRAEAALRENRLEDALTEIEALPEPAQAALDGWTAEVTRRLDALDAVETLGVELN